jgi:mono/diheme cytochrome c family protein
MLPALSALLLASASQNPHAANTGTASPTERGKYLVRIMACADCHNTGNFSPKPEEGFLEGATVGFEIPGMGVFYPPNLTPDPSAGIGKWSQAEIVTALRTGKTPDGRNLAPIMPWQRYAILTDEDANAIAAYLKSLAPSPHKVPPATTKDKAPQPFLTVAPPAKPAASSGPAPTQ